MNRIRKYNGKYQCLLTPHRKYDVGFEFILGSWTDETIKGFEVVEFDNYSDAENAIYDYPDINWNKLIELHKDCHDFLRHHILQIVKNYDLCVDVKPILLTASQVKNVMFDRVIRMQHDNNFRLIHNMNDIITITIINPWTNNLQNFAKILISDDRLKIIKSIRDVGIIHLIGKTDIGTTYTIILTTPIIYNWMSWKELQTNDKKITHGYDSCIKQQKIIDSFDALN